MNTHPDSQSLQDQAGSSPTGQQSAQAKNLPLKLNRSSVRWAIVGIMIQALLLIGMIGMAYYPLWDGTPIKLQTVPVDPRNLFRGNYIELNYDFNTLQLDSIPNDLERYPKLKQNDVVFIELAPDKNGIHQAIGVWSELPTRNTNICLKARISYVNTSSSYITVETDVQHYFASGDTIQSYERNLTIRTMQSTTEPPPFELIVKAKVTKNGSARLVGLIKIDSLRGR
jgi:uncharacterized membrane-anchored protein